MSEGWQPLSPRPNLGICVGGFRVGGVLLDGQVEELVQDLGGVGAG